MTRTLKLMRCTVQLKIDLSMNSITVQIILIEATLKIESHKPVFLTDIT